MRLSAHILELRKDGMQIDSEWTGHGQAQFKTYFLKRKHGKN